MTLSHGRWQTTTTALSKLSQPSIQCAVCSGVYTLVTAEWNCQVGNLSGELIVDGLSSEYWYLNVVGNLNG